MVLKRIHYGSQQAVMALKTIFRIFSGGYVSMSDQIEYALQYKID